MKKKIISLLLVFVLGISAFLFAGCQSFEDEVSDRFENEFSSENGENSASQFLANHIDGFKVVYTTSMRTGENGNISIIDTRFYKILLDELTKKYGTTDCPDSIRQLIIADGDSNAKLVEGNHAWKWTLIFDSPFTQEYIYNNMVNGKTYEQFKSSFVALKDYYPQLSEYYSTAIQIVMFETLLGYGKDKLTTFEADTTSGFVVKVKNCPTNSTLLNGKNVTDGDVESYLQTLSDEYYASASYSGFTKNTADRFITYLLDEVVGSELVEYDYKTYGPDETNPNYRNYVENIAELVYDKIYDGSGEDYTFSYKLLNGDEISYKFSGRTGEGSELAPKPVGTFSAQPSCFMSDFETEAFFEDGSALETMLNGGETTKTSFENSPLAEYQSVIMMPKQDYTFGGMVMQIFSANPDLQINMTLRFWAYDKDTHTGTLYKFKQEGINFYQSSPILHDGEDESVKVEGKGYLYKAKDKDNNGNEINGYYTDFEITFDASEVDEKFVENSDKNNPNVLHLDYLKLDEFDNTNLKATGESVNGRVEQAIDKTSGYKVVENEDGFGGVTVIDEKKIEFSFCEIMFDVVKDRTKENQDYTYKLAVLLPG